MAAIKGIDVSQWQGKIDWAKVKGDGVKFAIIRCGYGADKTANDDTYFERNVSECERLGINWGVYLFSYANSIDKAKSELAHILRLLKGKKPKLPVFYDLEDASTTGKCSKATILSMAKIVVNGLEAAGYRAGVYANLNWFTNYLTDQWYSTKPVWIAQYNTKCTYSKKYSIWQHSSTGKVSGISGNVDMNYCYDDLASFSVSDSGFSSTEYIKKGDKGMGVYFLKRALNALRDKGYTKHSTDDNDIFGAGTESALKDVQKAAGLTQDGRAGAKTIRAIIDLLRK